MDRVYEVLPQKFIAKELDSRQFDVRLLEKRRIEYERDWNNRLNYLIIQNKVDFEEAWQLILNLFKQLS